MGRDWPRVAQLTADVMAAHCPGPYCILTARIVLAVAARCDVAARPVPVTLSGRCGARVAAVAGSGSYRGTRWDGHLVVVADGLLIDAAAGVLAGPLGCPVGPLVVPLPLGSGRGPVRARLDRPDGLCVVWAEMHGPGRDGYRGGGGDWTWRPDVIGDAAAGICARL